MTRRQSFDTYLEPWLTSRAPRVAAYSAHLTEFREWVLTEVDAQANYTDRYAPPALETYDRNGEVINRVATNRWYDDQHTSADVHDGLSAGASRHQLALSGHVNRGCGVCTGIARSRSCATAVPVRRDPYGWSCQN